MTKSELREIAKNTLQEAIAVAYYRLENENYTTEETEEITRYIHQYGTAACKAFGKDYFTF